MLSLMPDILFIVIIVLVFSSIVLLALLLFFFEYKEHIGSDHKFLDQAKEKGYKLINQAVKKAQAILGEAELESIKIVAKNTLESRKLETIAEKQFEQSAENVEVLFEKYNKGLEDSLAKLNQAQDEFVSYLNGLKSGTNQKQTEADEAVKFKINQVFDRFERRLMDSLVKTQQDSVYSIQLEIKAARQLIDSYKQQQLTLIDENIIAVLERTLSLVISKKLSLQDQIDLVYEALEKAKLEKFIV